MPSNHAAYLHAKEERVKISEAPFPEPGQDQIVVKNAAVAINPVDWKIADTGMFVQSWPTILGCDVAGTVEAVGSGASGFKKGDRVFGHAQALGNGDNAQGAFQEYTVVGLPLVAKIPETLSFEEAAVLPLGANTASAGLFEEDKLAMAVPPSTDGKGKTVLIWGGSSSVGCCAIQLASAAGYEVFTTASSHNHDLCKALGASKVFDYKSDSLVSDIVSAMKGKDVVGGMDTIAEESTVKACCEILGKAGARKMLATTLPGTDKLASHGVEVKPVFALTVASNGIGAKVWEFLPAALSKGSFKAKPDPVSGGNGLESLQDAMAMNKKGVSGKKVVVTL